MRTFERTRLFNHESYTRNKEEDAVVILSIQGIQFTQ